MAVITTNLKTMKLIKDAPKRNTTQQKKNWAKRAYKNLMLLLGKQCQYCGTTENLQFDCIIPQGHEHHCMNTIGRVQFYRKQHFQFNNVQVLCEQCNGRKGLNERYSTGELQFQPLQPTVNPF